MMRLGEQLVGGGHQCIGMSLQDGPTPPLDFCRTLSQPGEGDWAGAIADWSEAIRLYPTDADKAYLA
jgi:hypothetical protein